MNYTKFGTRWGVSGQYIGRLARRKILPTIGGKIHVAKADETMKIQLYTFEEITRPEKPYVSPYRL